VAAGVVVYIGLSANNRVRGRGRRERRHESDDTRRRHRLPVMLAVHLPVDDVRD
jgi:hypothetical protein